MPSDRRSKRHHLYLKGDDSKNSTPSSSRKNLSSSKEAQPLLTVPTSNALSLDLNDGQRWSANGSYGVPRISSSDTFSRSVSRDVPCTTPWDRIPMPIPFQDAQLDAQITKAIIEDDTEALDLCGVIPNSKVAEKTLLLACRLGSNEIVKHVIKFGVKINCKDPKSGLDPVTIAAYFDNDDVVNSLLEEKPTVITAQVEIHGVQLSLLHLSCLYGCLSSATALVNANKHSIKVDVGDSQRWHPIHYAVAQGYTKLVEFLLVKGANSNAEGPYKVRPLHVAAYKNNVGLVDLLLNYGADARKQVTLNPPRYSFSFELMDLEHRKSKALPPVVCFNAKQYSTLLHWAVAKGPPSIVEKILNSDSGSAIDILDLQGRSPLGMALTEGKTEIIQIFSDKGIKLSDEDKNWRRIVDEENGLQVVDILEKTNLDVLNCSNKEGFSILHLAASKGYLSLLTKLLAKNVKPDLETVRGETPLFLAIENNHQACVQQLIKSGCNICHISKKNASVIHIAAKFNNFAAIDLILNLILTKKKTLDLNLADENGFTATYYAISASRYDIVQRLVQFSVSLSIHVKATKEETLLQFYTERNILGQYDNAIVRVLELEKELHKCKFNAEKCIRMQLGTTESSTKAREQLQAMYESTPVQRHCWNFWIVITCFLMPSVLYYLDVYTDVVLAVEYYNDYVEATTNKTGYPPNKKPLQEFFSFNITESQSKVNMMLTVFFILFPMALLALWSLYVHLTQEDILPPIKRMSSIQKGILYFFLFIPPLGPIISYIENSYAQVKYMNSTAEVSGEPDISPSAAMNLLEEDKKSKEQSALSIRLREHYNLKNVAQMRVAINNVLEATLESAFQLILQLYILGTQYKALKALHLGNMTIGSILSLTPTLDSQSRLSKQALSVLISLVSLTWSFTSYHRFSKLGGLRILWSLPLLFAIFFQIISRAIACTVFTLAYTWRIFIVLGIHYILVLSMKTAFERRTEAPKDAIFSCNPCFSSLRPYFYVILGAFTSTFVYFRIQKPLSDKDQLSQRHSSFFIQTLFLLLSLVENVVLYSVGVANLDEEKFDNLFKIVSGVLCLLSFIIGVVLQYIYYGCFGHPWVNINGPAIEKQSNGTVLVSFYKEGGQTQWEFKSCKDCTNTFEDEEDNIYLPKTFLDKVKANGLIKVNAETAA